MSDDNTTDLELETIEEERSLDIRDYLSSWNDIVNMKIGDQILVEVNNPISLQLIKFGLTGVDDFPIMTITRVPGGWIMHQDMDMPVPVFVPYCSGGPYHG